MTSDVFTCHVLLLSVLLHTIQNKATIFVSLHRCRSIYRGSYVLAQASGAHLNPAVSLGLLIGKRISLEQFVIYFIVQVTPGLSCRCFMISEVYIPLLLRSRKALFHPSSTPNPSN